MPRNSINRVIYLARYLGNCEFDSIDTLCSKVMKPRCFRLVGSVQTALLSFLTNSHLVGINLFYIVSTDLEQDVFNQ